mmetsp:Transcript_23245/g.75305  ORF Transcript_23245/g.75305 Transcript_23245/m.75305 type:complete len:288 (-) Transcript_23245:162-1025(-)
MAAAVPLHDALSLQGLPFRCGTRRQRLSIVSHGRKSDCTGAPAAAVPRGSPCVAAAVGCRGTGRRGLPTSSTACADHGGCKGTRSARRGPEGPGKPRGAPIEAAGAADGATEAPSAAGLPPARLLPSSHFPSSRPPRRLPPMLPRRPAAAPIADPNPDAAEDVYAEATEAAETATEAADAPVAALAAAPDDSLSRARTAAASSSPARVSVSHPPCPIPGIDSTRTPRSLACHEPKIACTFAAGTMESSAESATSVGVWRERSSTHSAASCHGKCRPMIEAVKSSFLK